MVDSANSLRRQRRALTARALTTPARLWTADRGIGGFTIDELCEAAGVSRRTFFNYFASKEDAVLGVCVERGDDHLAAAFIAGGRVAPVARLKQADPAVRAATMMRDPLLSNARKPG